MQQGRDLPERVRELTDLSERDEDDSDDESTGEDGEDGEDSSVSASVHDSDLAFVEAVSDFDSSDYDGAAYQTPSEGSSEHWEDESDHENDPTSPHDSPNIARNGSSFTDHDDRLAANFSTLYVKKGPVGGKARQEPTSGTQSSSMRETSEEMGK